MLKSIGKASLFLRFGRRTIICLRSSSMDKGFRARIRPFVIGWLSCWCDKQPNPG